MTVEAHYQPERACDARDKFVVISGCSGAGKSSLLTELAARGYRTFPEPGRQIVKEQTAIGRPNILDDDPVLFGELCIARTLNRMIHAADASGPMFFDRTHIDPLSFYMDNPADEPLHWRRAAEIFRFHPVVFFVPPWPEIFQQDAERRHTFEHSLAEYAVLLRNYERFGYRPVIVPKAPVPARADFVLQRLTDNTATAVSY